jgi:hypothetical protein
VYAPGSGRGTDHPLPAARCQSISNSSAAWSNAGHAGLEAARWQPLGHAIAAISQIVSRVRLAKDNIGILQQQSGLLGRRRQRFTQEGI